MGTKVISLKTRQGQTIEAELCEYGAAQFLRLHEKGRRAETRIVVPVSVLPALIAFLQTAAVEDLAA